MRQKGTLPIRTLQSHLSPSGSCFCSYCCGILLIPLRWFKQSKRTVSYDVTKRFNAIQQSTAMYNSHIFNVRNTTINVTKRSTINWNILSIQWFFYYPCLRQYFYINHMYSKSSHCNVSKLSVYYKIAHSFTLFSLRKCMQLHHFIL